MRKLATVALVLLAAVAVPVSADVLVLIDGRQLQGDLLGVSRGEVQFEVRDGGRRRTLVISRDEVARIDFDDRRRSGNTAQRPRGLRERRVDVSARQPWTDTGIEVRRGQEIYFTASGETRWGSNRRDGAEGERGSPVNPGRPIPNRPAAALVGRIGDGVFFIGAEQGPFRIPETGRLHLGINDDDLTDNTGSLQVTVYY